MAEYLDIDFVSETVIGNLVEEIGVAVIQLEVVNIIIVREQPAVEGIDPVIFVAFVYTLKQLEEVLPTRVRDTCKSRKLAVGPVNGVVRQKASILAKGNENDAVDDLLGCTDGLLQRFFKRSASEQVDEFSAVLVVVVIQSCSDLLLPLTCLHKQFKRPWLSPGRDFKQSLSLEQVIESAEFFLFAKILKYEELIVLACGPCDKVEC